MGSAEEPVPVAVSASRQGVIFFESDRHALFIEHFVLAELVELGVQNVRRDLGRARAAHEKNRHGQDVDQDDYLAGAFFIRVG